MTPEEFQSRLENIGQRFDRIAQGEVPAMEIAVEDLRVTLEELRVADEELRRQNDMLVVAHTQVEVERQRYRDLFELAPDAYLVTDAYGVVTEANQSASRLLGTAPRYLQGRLLANYVVREHRSDFRGLISRMTRNSHSHCATVTLQPREREPIAVEVTCSLIRDAKGHPAAIRWILRNVSEQRRMADEIRELNHQLTRQVADKAADLHVVQQHSHDLARREQAARTAAEASEAHSRHVQKLESIGVLAGGIAHDFNNLLHVVLGNADIAFSRLPPGAPAREPLEEVVRATLRAADLTRQLLAYSGKGAFVVGPVDLSHEMRDMAMLLRTAISKQATLVWELASGLPSIRADATQVRQVVMNLITNASDALGESTGTITLRTGLLPAEEVDRDQFESVDEETRAESPAGEAAESGRAPYVFLEVADTGAGMTPETLSRIFDPFFSTKFTGRGLGLAAVMGIVRTHNGLIRIRTEPGHGTTFRVLFPAVAVAARQHYRPAAGQLDWQGHGTVLVIDDEEGVREVIERMLQEIGFEARSAADGRQGLELLHRDRDRIVGVLLDLSMPEMGGQETFRRLRADYPHLPVIMMSGFTESVVADQVGNSASTDFLQKPFMAEDLIEAFRRAFQNSS
jgi:PAS domain S-box-containing protein